MVEVLIALTVLAVGVLGVTAALVTSLRHTGQSQNLTQAMYFAEQKIEEFNAMDGPDVLALAGTADPDSPMHLPGQDDIEFERRWTITADTPEVGLMTIVVEVDWVEGDRPPRTISLQTVKGSG